MKKMILVVAWLVVVVCFTSCLENETIPGDSQHVAPPATPSSRDSGNSEHPEWRRDYERHIDQWVDESANEADRFKEEERISRARFKLLEQEAAKNRNRFGGLRSGADVAAGSLELPKLPEWGDDIEEDIWRALESLLEVEED